MDESDMKIKIMYQSGKGTNHLVPVLILHNTVYAMKILSNVEIRKMLEYYNQIFIFLQVPKVQINIVLVGII